MKKLIKKEAKEVRGILGRVKRRDFSGNEGQAIRNSSYQIATLATAKIGSLILMVYLAWKLGPELFGLYSLALSTIIMFTLFSDLGIGSAMITFISKSLGKNKESEAKGYFKLLLKWRIFSILGAAVILLIFSKFLAENYYQKPIFLALLAGFFYILITQTLQILDILFQSANLFKPLFYKEIIFQIIKTILVPLAVILLLKTPVNIFLFYIIIILTISYIFPLVYLFIYQKKITFLSKEEKKISLKQKKNLIKFILPLSAIVLSGFLFGYIDMIMLGKFVSGEFIGYYSAAFNIHGSILAILAFSSAALFPILGRLSKGRLERGFQKSRKIVLYISLVSFIVVFFLASPIIKILYGSTYFPAINLFRILSLLIISFPLNSLYQTYYISQMKSTIVSKLLIFSTILNIVLTYVLIVSLASRGGYYSTIGAATASVISHYIHLALLILLRKKS
jgi:O-antigen/teichoic acid export membrane protein